MVSEPDRDQDRSVRGNETKAPDQVVRGTIDIQGLSALGPFPRTKRLLVRRQFLRVQGLGVRVETRNFVVVAHRERSTLAGEKSLEKTNVEPQPLDARLGLSVGKRVGNAVTRNRIKRIVREVFRRTDDLASADLVVIAKTSAAVVAREGLGSVASELLPAMRKAARRAQSEPSSSSRSRRR